MAEVLREGNERFALILNAREVSYLLAVLQKSEVADDPEGHDPIWAAFISEDGDGPGALRDRHALRVVGKDLVVTMKEGPFVEGEG
jgi:hypothetical protein